MPAFVVEKLCLGCLRCVDACPQGAIKVYGRKALVIPEKCDECEQCMELCMHGAITMQGGEDG